MRWATLDGFGRYEISELGRVRNARTKIPMLDYDDGKNGYRKIKLTSDGGKRTMFYVHRLVWQTFNGPILPKFEIDHMDGSYANNALCNLIPVTHRQNSILKRQRNSAYLFNRKKKRGDKRLAREEV